MDLTLESAIASAEADIERINENSKPLEIPEGPEPEDDEDEEDPKE